VDTNQDTSLNLWGAILGLLITLGLAGAGLLLGIGVTGLAGETKSFWYLSRAAGFVAYLLLWGSVVWGLLLSSKIGQGKLRPPALLDAHRFLSYVALGFAFFHGLVLMGDRYLSFPLSAILVPFAGSYKPTLVAAGQLALWLSLLVSLSFLVQKRIGRRAWRSLHYVSFAVYGLALMHSIWLGSESHLLVVKAMYLLTAEAVIFLTAYRISSRSGQRRAMPEQPTQASATN
jgi:DMSO/TMAO reductase YedYZ heme-binding membrane subunit